MSNRMCRQCMNFACPLKRVKPGLRLLFFARNPVVAAAWQVKPEK